MRWIHFRMVLGARLQEWVCPWCTASPVANGFSSRRRIRLGRACSLARIAGGNGDRPGLLLPNPWTKLLSLNAIEDLA